MPFPGQPAGNRFLSSSTLAQQLPIWLLTALLLAIVWLHTVDQISTDRTATLAKTENDLINLGRVSQEHAERTFFSADQTLRLVIAEHREHRGKLDLKALNAQGIFDSRILLQIAIIDAQGILQQSTVPFTGRIDLSDREHFKVHQASDGQGLFISRPVLGRASGKWSIQLSRRITNNKGGFGGVVVTSLDPEYFTRFYGELTLGKEAVATLFGVDGIVRARRVGEQNVFVGDISASPALLRIARGEQTSTLTYPSVTDGVERTYHLRKLPSYPLIVAIGMASKEIFAEHENTRSYFLRQATLVSLLLLALATVASWSKTAQRRHSEAQRRALDQLQSTTSRAPGLVYQYLLRPDGSSCLPFASEGIRDIYRLSPEDVAEDAAPIFSLVHPDDLAGLAESIQASARSLAPWVHEYRVRFADGTVRWNSGKATPQKQADGSVLWSGFISDATERKQAEESLVTLSAAVEQSPVSIVITDPKGSIQYVNPMFEQATGYTRAEAIGKNPRILSSGEKSGLEYRQMWATLSAGKIWHGEFHNRRKDGTLFWEHAAISPIFDDQGTVIHFIAIKEDVTERKRISEALQESEATLNTILDSMAAFIYIKDADYRYRYANRQVAELYGKPAKEIAGQEDQAFFDNETATRLREVDRRVIEAGEQISVEEIIAPKDKGELRSYLSVKLPLRRENGDIYALCGISTDITERKRIEDDLRIAATAFESQEGMFITDDKGIILRANQAFSEITGYSVDEAIGKTPGLFSSGRHDPGFYAAMYESIAQTGAWKGEIWNRRKNGEVFPEWLTITAVKNNAGKVTHHVSTLTDITQRKASEDKIKHLAFYDPLTRLPNRRLLIDRMNQAMAASTRSGCEGALLFIDLDNFKTLNDTLGHHMGDLLLQEVARRLTACVREADTVARLGGDEFVVMLEDLNKRPSEAAAQTEAVGEKILYALNLPFTLADHEYHNTPSIGVALFTDHQNSVDELMKRADLAMYQAKAAGRNTLRFFDPEMQASVNTRVALERDLRAGIQQHQLHLHYQVQVDHQGIMTGAEALVRWQHPERGMISPAEFIPLAEETGLILPLGEWVLDTACRQLRDWSASERTKDLSIAVNVSAWQFRQADFVDQVAGVLDRHGANPRRLKLELTESLLLDDVEDIIAKMAALKTKGVSFSLDDFGTGYSSLSYLKRLPLDQLKIDQSFVRDLLTDAEDAAIARTIVALAQSLGLGVIAEGVESEAQRAILSDLGCHAYQGYLFGRPGPVEALWPA